MSVIARPPFDRGVIIFVPQTGFRRFLGDRLQYRAAYPDTGTEAARTHGVVPNMCDDGVFQVECCIAVDMDAEIQTGARARSRASDNKFG